MFQIRWVSRGLNSPVSVSIIKSNQSETNVSQGEHDKDDGDDEAERVSSEHQAVVVGGQRQRLLLGLDLPTAGSITATVDPGAIGLPAGHGYRIEVWENERKIGLSHLIIRVSSVYNLDNLITPLPPSHLNDTPCELRQVLDATGKTKALSSPFRLVDPSGIALQEDAAIFSGIVEKGDTRRVVWKFADKSFPVRI